MEKVSIFNQLIEFNGSEVFLNGEPTEYTYKVTKHSGRKNHFGDWDVKFYHNDKILGNAQYQSNTEEINRNIFIAASRDILFDIIYTESSKQFS